jgi:hypothetical protein
MVSETRIALKLDVLNKKLDKELVGALQESEFEKEQLRLRRASCPQRSFHKFK